MHLSTGAIDKAGIPSLLISCKCDAPPEERDVNPRTVELAAKRNVKDLETLRVSSTDPDSHRQGVSMILKAIVSGIAEISAAKGMLHALSRALKSPC